MLDKAVYYEIIFQELDIYKVPSTMNPENVLDLMN